jgi:FMN reductase
LKHLFDLVDYRSLEGTPVLLCATGGTPLHGLMIDHQFRPLFAFFKALTLPTSIYALEGDFDGYDLRDTEVFARIERSVAEAHEQLKSRGARRSGTVLPFVATA